MAKKSKFELIVQILLLAAVIFFGIILTNALDRNRCEMAELRKTIAAMSRQTVVASVPDKMTLPPEEKSVLAKYYKSDAPVDGVLRTAIASDTGSLNPVTGNEALLQPRRKDGQTPRPCSYSLL